MRARRGMPKEGAHPVRHFRAEDVLEFAGARLDFFFVLNRKHVHKQALGQTVAPDDVAGAGFASRREYRIPVLNRHESDFRHRSDEALPLTRREMVGFDMAGHLAARPEVFENLVEVLIFLRAEDPVFLDAPMIQIQPTNPGIPLLSSANIPFNRQFAVRQQCVT